MGLSQDSESPVFFAISAKTGNLILQALHQSLCSGESQTGQKGDLLE